MPSDTEFAVVDVETTGIFPDGSDRIIEIAILLANVQGHVRDEYATLVNPRRDLGPTHVHGIRAREVLNAPPFEAIAGDVLRRMNGAVFTSHNIHFDLRFVQAEMRRIGCELPPVPCLCTMQLARKADPLIPSRRLAELCTHFGLAVHPSHSAYEDAHAAVMLLSACAARLGDRFKSCIRGTGINDRCGLNSFWPSLPVTRTQYRRETASKDFATDSSYMETLINRLPATGCESPEVESYLMLLDRALEDRRLSEAEGDALLSMAESLGLSRNQVEKAHRCWMRDILFTALADGIITQAEQRDIEELCRSLCIGRTDYQALLREAELGVCACAKPVHPARTIQLPDVKGKSICFTGTMTCRIRGEQVTRDFAEQMAAEHGMIVKNNVSKVLDYLVVADPDSLSGKAKRAREYGVRILVEPVFWRMLGNPDVAEGCKSNAQAVSQTSDAVGTSKLRILRLVKKPDKVLAGVEASRRRPLARLIAALNIPHVGVSTALLLAEHFGNIEAVQAAGVEQLQEIPGIGPELAESIHTFMTSEQGRQTIDDLRAVGVNLAQPRTQTDGPRPFAGMSIVVTGTLEGFSRKEIQDLITKLGGKAVGSVSKSTSFVVAGAEAGSKLDKAQSLGVEVIDEAEFRKRAGLRE
jgi:DNA polymerase-3 subunit epsilon